MTYDTDPTRWTEAPGSAPESLRDAFEAGYREGPSELQMRSLALKLATMSGGAALAATASRAQASSAVATGGATSTLSFTLSFTKVAVSLALVGAAALGTAIYREPQVPAARHGVSTPTASSPFVSAPVVAPAMPAPSAHPSVDAMSAVAAVPRARLEPVAEQKADEAKEQVDGSPARAPQVGEPSARVEEVRPLTEAMRSRSARERRRPRSELRARSSVAVTPGEVSEAEPIARKSAGAEAPAAAVPEIDLLRSARANLAARPREAYRLTEQHRREYPKGVFVQERDALAIEALLRAGELKDARALAEKFIERYPGSPHAHRFRESMEIP